MPIHFFLAAKKFLWCLAVFSIFANTSYAATRLVFDTQGNIVGSYVEGTPSHNVKMQAAISGSIQQAASTRGFTQADPRVAATLTRTSGVFGSFVGTAAAVTVGAVTAPSWGAIALAAGVGAVVSYGVTLAVDGLVKWLFGSSTVDVENSGAVQAGLGMSAGGSFWSTGSPRGTIHGGDGIAVARQGYNEFAAQYGVTASPICTSDSSIARCVASQPDAIGSTLVRQALFYTDGAPANCLGGHFYIEGLGCLPFAVDEQQNQQAVSIQEATAALPTAERGKPLNPALIAALANRGWSEAASKPGYDGLPYSISNPITATDVTTWLKANPEYWPTVDDFVSPNPDLSTGPGASTGTGENGWELPKNPPAQTNPTEGNQKPDLGPDPGIGSPTLEAIPTAQQIANPILQLAPDLRGFRASGQLGVCPRPTIELYGTHVLDAHCKLIEDNKQVLQLAMAFAWAMMALFVVLSA